jgi:isopenicillin-N N-acyltransferase-like protein
MIGLPFRRISVREARCLLAILVVCTHAIAASPGDASREFPEAIVVAGKPAERGREYGKRFREAIHDFLNTEIYAAFVGRPATKEQMLGYAAACGKLVRNELPMIVEEFQGIADGAQLTFDEVMLINLHEELYHRTQLPGHGHCTAIAVAAPDTGNGHTYVAQTWDWMQSVAGKSRVIEWRRNDGPSVLAYGFPGMPMGAGVNSARIALCWTSARLGNGSGQPRVGIPSYVLIAHLLAQPDMDSVIREAKKNKHAGWFTFVMADGAGNLVNIEGSPEKVVVEQAKGRLVRVDYGSAEMRGDKPGDIASLHPRCQLMYNLLGESQTKNDLSRLQTYLADPERKINVGKGTIDMMVFDTTARAAYLSRGSSYNLSWRKFAFSKQ